MAIPKPLEAKPALDKADEAVRSALRTLDAEGSGITALAAALEGPLGAAFTGAVELIRNAKGRVIVTGLGKSGHVARKIAATLASTGTFRARGGSKSWRSRHDHAGRCHRRAVMVRRAT